MITEKEKYTSRHIDTKNRLMEISAKKSDKKGIMYVCHEISKELGVTAQTVYNYTKGRITDGYLADSIISALKKYRHNKRDN